MYTHCIGLANIWDLAMNCTLRLSAAPRKKWSMNEKWFGARITGPLAGTSSGLIGRSRTKVHAYRDSTLLLANWDTLDGNIVSC